MFNARSTAVAGLLSKTAMTAPIRDCYRPKYRIFVQDIEHHLARGRRRWYKNGRGLNGCSIG
jgi:hypothetical protein